MENTIKGDLNEVLKALASELAFTDKGINKSVTDMVKYSVKRIAKDLKDKEAALADADIEDLEVACYICAVTDLLLNHFADFVEKQNNVKH